MYQKSICFVFCNRSSHLTYLEWIIDGFYETRFVAKLVCILRIRIFCSFTLLFNVSSEISLLWNCKTHTGPSRFWTEWRSGKLFLSARAFSNKSARVVVWELHGTANQPATSTSVVENAQVDVAVQHRPVWYAQQVTNNNNDDDDADIAIDAFIFINNQRGDDVSSVCLLVVAWVRYWKSTTRLCCCWWKWCERWGCEGLMSPYSRYRPLPGSDGITVLQTPPGCRPTGPTACRFLRWIAKLSPQTVNNKGIGERIDIPKRHSVYFGFNGQ